MRGGFCKKTLQTETSQQVSASLTQATFSLEDVTNVHNLHTLAIENQHAICAYASQRKFTFNMRADVVGNYLHGPYILPEIFDGCINLAFLQEVQYRHAERCSYDYLRRFQFQNDEATAHLSR